MKSAVAIRHVHFEDLGIFERPLQRAGYQIYYLDAGLHELGNLDPQAADILFVLGAPIGAGETEQYPFLKAEYTLIRERLAADRPLMGICLGAQLMAATSGQKVYPCGHKEIGFAPLTLTGAGLQSPLRHLEGTPVLHWHGDTFDMPPGTVHLAETPLCRHQAFSSGRNVLGVQFHAEADPARIERWLIGHACELAGAGISPEIVRKDALRFGPALAKAGENMIAEWLEQLDV